MPPGVGKAEDRAELGPRGCSRVHAGPVANADQAPEGCWCSVGQQRELATAKGGHPAPQEQPALQDPARHRRGRQVHDGDRDLPGQRGEPLPVHAGRGEEPGGSRTGPREVDAVELPSRPGPAQIHTAPTRLRPSEPARPRKVTHQQAPQACRRDTVEYMTAMLYFVARKLTLPCY
jgi:hypothetical protein